MIDLPWIRCEIEDAVFLLDGMRTVGQMKPERWQRLQAIALRKPARPITVTIDGEGTMILGDYEGNPHPRL